MVMITLHNNVIHNQQLVTFHYVIHKRLKEFLFMLIYSQNYFIFLHSKKFFLIIGTNEIPMYSQLMYSFLVITMITIVVTKFNRLKFPISLPDPID